MKNNYPLFEEYLHEKKHIWKAVIYLKAIMMCKNSFQVWNLITFNRDEILQCFGESTREFIEKERLDKGRQ